MVRSVLDWLNVEVSEVLSIDSLCNKEVGALLISNELVLDGVWNRNDLSIGRVVADLDGVVTDLRLRLQVQIPEGSFGGINQSTHDLIGTAHQIGNGFQIKTVTDACCQTQSLVLLMLADE